MTTTAQDLIARAKSYSPLNASLATDPVEMLTRIQQDQQRIFTAAAGISTERFQATQSLTSTSGSSGRVVDLTTLSLPLERLLTVTTPSGEEARKVSVQDTDAELAPRYLVRGRTLVEVGNDWSATSGTVSLAIVYVYGATPITVTGGTSQVMSLPDEWIDLLIKPLAMYFHTKDPGRDPSEYDRLSTEYQATWTAFMAYLTDFGGLSSERFAIPAPSPTGLKP